MKKKNPLERIAAVVFTISYIYFWYCTCDNNGRIYDLEKAQAREFEIIDKLLAPAQDVIDCYKEYQTGKRTGPENRAQSLFDTFKDSFTRGMK